MTNANVKHNPNPNPNHNPNPHPTLNQNPIITLTLTLLFFVGDTCIIRGAIVAGANVGSPKVKIS